jgi:hypothetical protein
MGCVVAIYVLQRDRDERVDTIDRTVPFRRDDPLWLMVLSLQSLSLRLWIVIVIMSCYRVSNV